MRSHGGTVQGGRLAGELLDMARTADAATHPLVPVTRFVRVVWGSTSGHTEYVVERLIDVLGRGPRGSRVQAGPAETFPVTPVVQADVLVLASSTWSSNGVEGELNPHMADLVQHRASDLQVEGMSCACIGLGDHRYYYEARAADLLERFVRDHDGRLIVPTLRLIDEPYGQERLIDDWARGLVEAMGR